MIFNIGVIKAVTSLELWWFNGYDHGRSFIRSPLRIPWQRQFMLLSNALYPHVLVLRRGLKAVGPHCYLLSQWPFKQNNSNQILNHVIYLRKSERTVV